MAKPQIDKNNQKYLSGKLGGKPKYKDLTKDKPKANQTITKPTPKEKEKENVKEKEKVKRKKEIVASFEDFIELVKEVDWKTQFPEKNIEIEKKRCWAKL